jgi:hypothetical protein
MRDTNALRHLKRGVLIATHRLRNVSQTCAVDVEQLRRIDGAGPRSSWVSSCPNHMISIIGCLAWMSDFPIAGLRLATVDRPPCEARHLG